MGRLVSQAEAAREVGKTRQYINKLVKKNIVNLYKGKVDMNQVLKALDCQPGQEAAAPQEPTQSQQLELDLKAEQARLAKERADEKALQNAQARNELVPADVVVESWQKHISAAKAHVCAIPAKAVALGIIQREQQQELKKLCDDALLALANYDTAKLLPEVGRTSEEGA